MAHAMAAPRVLSVTSGKGGVGKTSIVANLAYVLCAAGKRVFELDADIGLANIDVMLGMAPQYNLEHVLSGEKRIQDIIVEGPGGMQLLPASSGVQELAELSQEQKMALLSEFSSLSGAFDFLFIDTGAGISSNVMYFNLAAPEKIVVATPEPTSITDAYALMKVMSRKYDITRFNLIMNAVTDQAEGEMLYTNVSSVAQRFLNIAIDYCGCVVRDERMSQAIRQQRLITEAYPQAPASLAFARVAQTLLENRQDTTADGSIAYFWNNLLQTSG